VRKAIAAIIAVVLLLLSSPTAANAQAKEPAPGTYLYPSAEAAMDEDTTGATVVTEADLGTSVSIAEVPDHAGIYVIRYLSRRDPSGKIQPLYFKVKVETATQGIPAIVAEPDTEASNTVTEVKNFIQSVGRFPYVSVILIVGIWAGLYFLYFFSVEYTKPRLVEVVQARPIHKGMELISSTFTVLVAGHFRTLEGFMRGRGLLANQKALSDFLRGILQPWIIRVFEMADDDLQSFVAKAAAAADEQTLNWKSYGDYGLDLIVIQKGAINLPETVEKMMTADLEGTASGNTVVAFMKALGMDPKDPKQLRDAATLFMAQGIRSGLNINVNSQAEEMGEQS
jgi:hypothetical protein